MNITGHVTTIHHPQIWVAHVKRISSTRYSCSYYVFIPANIHLFKVNNWNSKGRCEICLKLTIKTLGQRRWRHSGVFIVDSEHISHLFLVFFCWFFVFCLLSVTEGFSISLLATVNLPLRQLPFTVTHSFKYKKLKKKKTKQTNW